MLSKTTITTTTLPRETKSKITYTHTLTNITIILEKNAIILWTTTTKEKHKGQHLLERNIGEGNMVVMTREKKT